MQLFTLNASRTFAEKIAAALGVELSSHEEREFEDGEHKARPLASVRGEDVYVVQSLHGGPDQSPNDKLCRLLFFLATMKENGAARVTAVIPYLAYARKDRQTKPRDPVTTRYVAELLEAAGADCVVTLDVHNIVAFQNAFRCETIHLDTRRLFAERAVALIGEAAAVVASPDPGGVKRAQLFREMLETMLGRPVGSAFMEKRRSAGVVSGNLLVGDVAGATVLIVDDLISGGGTMARASHACREGGAKTIYAFAAHGLFTGEAASALRHSDLAKTFVTDTVPPFRLDDKLVGGRVEILSAAPLFAKAIRALHEDGSINALLEG
ncbi:ribose-phosphate diphosphokinase [Methylocapsa aurea]|uniref:ribose-phosphate diphosphokinase n=1 Tax=Methylocapsa aurea TaxID=663610 RepID=UPI000561A1D2|nr:ribose-phosphate pyrophosphokinase [Methylocapsa aurea]